MDGRGSLACGPCCCCVLPRSSGSAPLKIPNRHRRAAGDPAVLLASQIEPLRRLQVWRFGLYYFFVFGGYVALTVWLPRYLIAVYGLDIRMAAAIAVAFSLPAGLLRVLGGVLSDRYGARTVMYWSFIGSLACTFILSYPATDYIVHGLRGELRFTIATGH